MKYSIEQLADLRCRLYEQEHQREVAARRAREAAELQQNKGDVTGDKPKAGTPVAANTNTGKTATFQIRKL
ncbi:MAG: hypothetical protein PW788_00345 [Micavibrio sp.]|nr:hypothetical protein [Micavibrio sp.]